MTITETGSTEIMACPFCGGEASGDGRINYSDKAARDEGWDQSEFYYANCMKCGASNQGLVGHKSKNAAITAWNTRSLRNAQSEAVAWPGQCPDCGCHTKADVQRADGSVDGRVRCVNCKRVFGTTHPAPQSEAVAVQALDRDRLADLISRAGAPPGPPDGPIRALPETHFMRVQAYKQADAVLSALTHPAPPLAVTDAMVSRAAEVHWAESFKKTPTEAMRAALTAALEAKQ